MVDAANLIIHNAAGKVLLQMRDDTPGIRHPLKWGLWGGGIEPEDADCFAAATREMYEELGIKAAVQDFTLAHKRHREDGVVGHYLRYQPPLEWGDFKVLEGAGAAYFTLAEIKQLSTSNNIQWALAHHPEIFA